MRTLTYDTVGVNTRLSRRRLPRQFSTRATGAVTSGIEHNLVAVVTLLVFEFLIFGRCPELLGIKFLRLG